MEHSTSKPTSSAIARVTYWPAATLLTTWLLLIAPIATAQFETTQNPEAPPSISADIGSPVSEQEDQLHFERPLLKTTDFRKLFKALPAEPPSPEQDELNRIAMAAYEAYGQWILLNNKDRPSPAESKVALGAVIAVVHNGESLTMGFGCQNAASDKTIPFEQPGAVFRVGSISKVFTATAAMQLVEKGTLDLEEDVNKYLEEELRLPDTFPNQKVTLRHLLTHSGGLEENQMGFIVKRREEDLKSLDDTLRENIPRRVWPPTEDLSDLRDVAYSSWGIALVGHIVAKYGGKASFDEYVQENIFNRLAMKQSSFRDRRSDKSKSAPSEILDNLAIGHQLVPINEIEKHEGNPVPAKVHSKVCQPNSSYRFVPGDFEYLSGMAPSGGLMTSAEDMAHFMIAHLEKGAYKGEQLLKPETIELMHGRGTDPERCEPGKACVKRGLAPTPCAIGAPCVNGSGLGFYEMHREGIRVLSHRGATLRSAAKMVLIPDKRTGFFIATNTAVSSIALRSFALEVIYAITKPPKPFAQIPDEPFGDVAKVTGWYASNAHSYSRPEKAFLLTSPVHTMHVTAVDPHTISITNLLGRPTTWQQVSNDTFQQVALKAGTPRDLGQEQIRFLFDETGTASHLLTPMAFDPAYRIPWHERPGLHFDVAVAAMMISIVVIGWSWPAMFASPDGFSGWDRATRPLAGLSAGLMPVAYALLMKTSADPFGQIHGYTATAQIGFGMMNILGVIWPVMLVLTLRAWRRPQVWTRADAITLSAHTLGLTFVVASMCYWNLISLPF